MTTSLLDRQLRRLGLDADIPPDAERWRAFLERVRRTYTEAEQDRYTLERAFDLTSKELMELNAGLRREREALRESHGAAEAASRARSEFLAVMSHEVRTPMNAVIGMMGLLLDTPLSAEQREFAETARRSGEALLALLHDILDYTELDAERLVLDDVDFDPLAVLDEVATAFREAATHKGLRLVVRDSPDVPARVRGDPARLRQVLAHLVDNAIKFTERGGVELRVEPASALPTAETCLRFTVTDSGIGIAPEARPALFAPFTMGDASTTRRNGGTGLGLALCRRLATRMGGEIGVESEPGRGSAFWFTGRLRQPSVGHSASGEYARLPPQVAGSVATSSRSASTPARVLVVEDNVVNQKVVTLMLERQGCRVDVAANGVEALAAAACVTYDLIFMDCQMPAMDGYEATRALRARERRGVPRVPIVAMTANALAGDRERCLDAGMDDYLAKPITTAGLREGLARWSRRPAGSGTDARRGNVG